jgi:hypothetical protein
MPHTAIASSDRDDPMEKSEVQGSIHARRRRERLRLADACCVARAAGRLSAGWFAPVLGRISRH